MENGKKCGNFDFCGVNSFSFCPLASGIENQAVSGAGMGGKWSKEKWKVYIKRVKDMSGSCSVGRGSELNSALKIKPKYTG